MKTNSNPQFAPMSPLTEHYVMNDNVWKADIPAFLREIMECSQNVPYKVTFTIVGQLLKVLAQRAIEINDPALNIIMLHLSLYDGAHSDNAWAQIAEQREIIKEYQQQNQTQ